MSGWSYVGVFSLAFLVGKSEYFGEILILGLKLLVSDEMQLGAIFFGRKS
jgi:hypothetical protein